MAVQVTVMALPHQLIAHTCCCFLCCLLCMLCLLCEQNVLGVDFSGSTFVAVSGHDDHPNHTSLILRAAAAMLSVAAATRQPDGSPLAVRLGIHTGPLTTGMPCYVGVRTQVVVKVGVGRGGACGRRAGASSSRDVSWRCGKACQTVHLRLRFSHTSPLTQVDKGTRVWPDAGLLI